MRLTIPSLTLGVLLVGGCRGTPPPYTPGNEPPLDDLLARVEPPLDSVRVPRAKVRQAGGPAANLMMLAQHPQRFAGTIQISGNELVSLALNEEEYGLRWIGRGNRGLASGYYSGPPSRCAVEALLGVELDPEVFVDFVLGGGPLIDEPLHVVERHWDRKRAREIVVVENDAEREELVFAWDGTWHFAGASLWRLDGSGSHWQWSVLHTDLHEVDGHTLPRKTQIRQPTPNGKGELVVEVTYERQTPNPELGPSPNRGSAGDQWDDDGGWDDDEGGDDEGDDEGGDDEAGEDIKPEPVAEIPEPFRGNPRGLTPRGDLCR